jgi:hypothetical protein
MPRSNPLIVGAIPLELRELPRWTCWHELPGMDGKKPGKPPINPNVPFAGNHVYARCNDATTWAPFDAALRYWREHLHESGPASGLNFVLNGDGIVGIDLDDCRDLRTGAIDRWALEIISRLSSYTEFSPSGRGIRMFLRGALPAYGRHKEQVEVYDTHKFLSVTGRKLTNHGASDGVEDRAAELIEWHREVFGASSTSTREAIDVGHVVINDPPQLHRKCLDLLFRAKPKAAELYRGERDGHASQSEVDLALANFASAAGWSAQETCDLLVAARQKAGEVIKPLDYFARTIAKARSTRVGGIGAQLVRHWSTPGTDDVVIGSATPEVASDVEGATMADVAALVSSVKYLVKDWVPFGMITGLVAEPGTGKSAFALWLAKTVATGGQWFNGRRGPSQAGYVLWCGTENDTAITLERMRKWNIPPERLLLPFKDDPLRPINLADEAHLSAVEAIVRKYCVPLVVVDSLRSGHDGDENSSRVGRVMQQLAAVAERTGAAILIVHHTRKLMVDEEITANSSRGSNAILALMRSQIGIDRPDKASKWCRVRVLKENLGLAPAPLGFRVTDGGLEFGPAPKRPTKETRGRKAADWLLSQMKPGEWHLAAELQEKAKDYSPNALQRAREQMGVTQATGNIRQRDDGKYEWRLPISADVAGNNQ